jgi:hypothetical protein
MQHKCFTNANRAGKKMAFLDFARNDVDQVRRSAFFRAKKRALLIVFLLIISCPVSLFSQEKEKEKKDTVMITEALTPEMSVVNNRLYLKNAPIGKKVEIITIIGNKVREIQIKSPSDEYELNLPRAIYIFKLDGVVKKFVIK